MKNRILMDGCMVVLLCWFLSACNQRGKVNVETVNDSTIAIEMSGDARYLWIPVDEEVPLCQLRAEHPDHKCIPFAGIRPALEETGHFVPVLFPAGVKRLLLSGISKGSSFVNRLSASDERPSRDTSKVLIPCHYAPSTGWMGSIAGAVFKDGTYHIYYETNPHGNLQENLHWGHATSEDLIHWKEQDIVIGVDSLGECLGGSVVEDARNIFGAGKGALIAMYTVTRGSGNDRRQEQCLAFSKDGGMTFSKFVTNPVLRTYDDDPNFRLPNVVRYAKGGWWSVVLSCGKHLRIYSSDDLGNWNLESYMDDCAGTELLSYAVGNHPQKLDKKGLLIPSYEGAQLVETALAGSPCKWSLLCNAYDETTGNILKVYAGDFDGRTFSPLSGSCTILDGGGSYSGSMTVQGTDGRCIVLGRLGSKTGCMALPRELKYVQYGGKLQPCLFPAKEVENLRKEECTGLVKEANLIVGNLSKDGSAHEICVTVEEAVSAVFELKTLSGEKISFRCPDGKSQWRIFVTGNEIEAFSDIPGATVSMHIDSPTAIESCSLEKVRARVENSKVYSLNLEPSN